MPLKHFILLLGCMLAIAGTACADGLIQSLPEDGSWVSYNFRVALERQGTEKVGTLTVSSVGSVQHAGKPHRWIEFVVTYNDKFGGDESTEIDKYLIPESELTRDGSPMANLVRGWEQDNDQPIRETTNDNGPLDDLWLPGPLTDRTETPAPRTVEYQRGPLELKTRVEGVSTWKSERGLVQTTEYKIWPTAAVPFGVGAVEETLRFVQGETNFGTYRYVLEVQDFGAGATTSLPNSN